MKFLDEFDQRDSGDVGRCLHRFAAELYPICRSITGDGVRETLRRIGERIPLQLREVPTGTAVFDWTIPKEWNIRSAFIADPAGEKVVDFADSNLHVMSYSVPIDRRISLQELQRHLHSIPDQPDKIPYRTSYYEEDWGFCLSHRDRGALRDSEYQVHIDSTLQEGSLTYAECFLPGESKEEVLISSHICHPSLANDNLSGIVVATELARFLSPRRHRYSYRFLFAPGTIGAITWLSVNRENIGLVKHGLVLTGIGNDDGFHYKKSRRGTADIDRVMTHILRTWHGGCEILDFSPYGYDERQYCSPGFDLPVGCLMRSVWGTFPEYHSSGDNLGFIKPTQLADSLRLCVHAVDVLERNRFYQNLNPYCEPQLSKRQLYGLTPGKGPVPETTALLWVLNMSDGRNSLLDIAERSGSPFAAIACAADALVAAQLIAEISA